MTRFLIGMVVCLALITVSGVALANTTTVYCGVADGQLSSQDVSYTVARNAATGVLNAAGPASMAVGQAANFLGSGTYFVVRSFITCDTSFLFATDIVQQVNLSLAIANDFSAVEFNLLVVDDNWTEPLATGEFPSPLSSPIDVTWRTCCNGLSAGQYYASPNMSTAWITKGGTTRYALISASDYTGSGTPPTDYEMAQLWSAENGQPSEVRPKLVIQWAAPTSTPTSNITATPTKTPTATVTLTPNTTPTALPTCYANETPPCAPRCLEPGP